MNFQELIQTVKKRRKVLNVNQEEVALLSGVGLRTLKHFESGKGNITLKNLQKILEVLGLELNLTIKDMIQWDKQKFFIKENQLVFSLSTTMVVLLLDITTIGLLIVKNLLSVLVF